MRGPQKEVVIASKGTGEGKEIPTSVQSDRHRNEETVPQKETEAGYQPWAQHIQTQRRRQRATEDRFRWAQMEPEPGLGTERPSS